MSNEQTVPAMDHDVNATSNEPTTQELLDAVMANSPIMDELGGAPLPEEEVPEVDSVEEVDEEDPEEISEDVSEEGEEIEEEAAGEDDTSTQDTDVYALDDLDLDAQVTVKIDGEEVPVSFNDLIKGYATEQSLSKKGRELGEARKALEEEREAKLAEVEQVGQAAAATLFSQEERLSKNYHALEAKIQKARDEGDTFELGELKDKREQVQKQYWNARNQREGIMGQMEQAKRQQAEELHQKQMQHFVDTIETYVPGFDDKMAGEIRSFALEEGLNEAVVDSIMDPQVVKMLNDYRQLKQGVSKGVAKRKAVPQKKAVPTKKAKTPAQKKASSENMTKARAFRDDASPDDHMAFLRQHASKTLGNLK